MVLVPRGRCAQEWVIADGAWRPVWEVPEAGCCLYEMIGLPCRATDDESTDHG